MDSYFLSKDFKKTGNNCYQTFDEYQITVITDPFMIYTPTVDPTDMEYKMLPYSITSDNDKISTTNIIINWIKDPDRIDGFEEETESYIFDTEIDYKNIKLFLPKIKVNIDRKIDIYTWGRKKRDCPKGFDKNFNAAIINGKKRGANIRRYDGRTEEVQYTVVRGKFFFEFFQSIIKSIEKDNLSIIGINCSAGRHRCVSCAELLKKYYYPNAILHHLELN